MRAVLDTLVGIDIGSTMVKAVLLIKQSGKWRMSATAWAPTTIEAPFENVTVGVAEAIKRLEMETGRLLMKHGQPLTEKGADYGCDAIICTSSAGGGCQMMVMGIMKELTAESAQRAVLGGGALVLDVIAVDDGRTVVERIELLKRLAPDAILVSGGTDGGNASHVVALAEIIKAASPSPRFGEYSRTPIVYAANVDARGPFLETVGQQYDVRFVDNLRPVMEREVMGPARDAIGRVFLEHVVHQAPGYDEIQRWTEGLIRPTPAAIGHLLERFAAKHNINVLAVDVGGATTDVFSVMDGVFNRTVSAGTGVGYAMGWGKGIDFEAISSWVPEEIPLGKFKNWVANKMINPTAIPETLEELLLEHSLARHAVSTAMKDHHKLAVELKGVQKRRGIADVFDQVRTGQSRVKMTRVDALVAMGGPFAHAPETAQVLAVLIDSVQPEGITEVYVDSSSVLPVVGLVEEIEPNKGLELMEDCCLQKLATAICPSYASNVSGVVLKATFAMPDGSLKEASVRSGTIETIPLGTGQVVDAILRPSRGVDIGNGPGRLVKTRVEGGEFGVIIDARGRPLDLAARKSVLSVLASAPADGRNTASGLTGGEGSGDL